MWGEFLAENGAVILTAILSVVALFVSVARNQVDDRQQELAMQGAYLEASKEDRQEVREMRAIITGLQQREITRQEEIGALQVALSESGAKSDKLVERLNHEQELRKTERRAYEAQVDKLRGENEQLTGRVTTMTAENKKLRERVAALGTAMEALQKRMDEVEAQSIANKEKAEALRTSLDEERATRKAIEAERDKLQAERDSLLEKVETLEKALQTERERVTEQSEALQALRDELDKMKEKLEEDKADG